MGLDYPYEEHSAPISVLTTDQVERLAKAGVTIELANKVLVQDPPPTPPDPYSSWNDKLTSMIYARWRMSKMGKDIEPFSERFIGPTLKSVEHSDKVYVFAYSGNAAPEIIEDVAAIYPSDALLARIHLMMQHAK